MAEKKEINQLAGQFIKSIRSPNFHYYDLPDTYTLGKGHVRFWYRYGTFIRNRYKEIYEECVKREFDVQDNFNDVWKQWGSMYNYDFQPQPVHLEISKDRIRIRFEEKPDFYKYYGKPVDKQSYLWALHTDNPKWIKEKRTN